jgi:hypothetical protein
MTSSELPREVKQVVFYLGNDVLDRAARKMPVNNGDRLVGELRQVAVEYNVEVAAVHNELQNILTILFDPDDLDQLKRSSLQFLIASPAIMN